MLVETQLVKVPVTDQETLGVSEEKIVTRGLGYLFFTPDIYVPGSEQYGNLEIYCSDDPGWYQVASQAISQFLPGKIDGSVLLLRANIQDMMESQQIKSLFSTTRSRAEPRIFKNFWTQQILKGLVPFMDRSEKREAKELIRKIKQEADTVIDYKRNLGGLLRSFPENHVNFGIKHMCLLVETGDQEVEIRDELINLLAMLAALRGKGIRIIIRVNSATKPRLKAKLGHYERTVAQWYEDFF